MNRCTPPITINGYTLRGVDDWLCFGTDDATGDWVCWYTECSPMWPLLPKCFIGKVGYPDTAEGVLATAILEIEHGIKPELIEPEGVAELVAAFGEKEIA